MISVVGLGPAGPQHLTERTLELVDAADLVFLRTLRHPSAAAILKRRSDTRSFDDEYETGRDHDEVYSSIVGRLLDAATGGAAVCYAVPGSPVVAERTVQLLRELAPDRSVEVGVEPAVSYLDLAWDRLGVDPLAIGVRLADASSFGVSSGGQSGPVLLAQAWSRQVLSGVKLALENPPPAQEAVILHHLGLADERVETVEWADLDRVVEPDHLTSVFVARLEAPPAAELMALVETVATLRQRCPWDREQTHRSLVRHLLEETYEAIEALEALGEDPAAASLNAAAHVEEELGDVLCQVVFHATLGTEEGLFTLGDIARSVNAKLVARHPHVFGDVVAETADDVVRNWERSKDSALRRTHLLEGIPAAMPALARTDKVERKLRSVGLGWQRSGEALEELTARLASLYADRDRARAAEEIEPLVGDLLLLIGRFSADRRVDPEAALRHGLERLGARVAELEAQARDGGANLADWLDEESVHKQHLPLC
ncbi:MAG: MazG family protein [Acidimicrobiales bacterium]